MLVPGRAAVTDVLNRRRIIPIAAVIVATVAFAAVVAGGISRERRAAYTSASPEHDGSAVVARVNGVPIFVEELERAMAALRESFEGTNVVAWRRRVLDSLINSELLRQTAHRGGGDLGRAVAVRETISSIRSEGFGPATAASDRPGGSFQNADEFARDLHNAREAARRYRERIETVRQHAKIEVDEIVLAKAGIRPK